MGNKFRKFWKLLGPGLITGAADDEPSGIATYTIAGAKYGLSVLWMALFTLPLMIAVQEMSARIGRVTNKGLAGNMKQHYPKWLLLLISFLIIIANTINIGADMSGMAQSLALIMPFPEKITAIIMTLAILTIIVFLPYRHIFSIFKWMALSLFSYIIAAFFVHINWSEIFYSFFVPRIILTKDYFIVMAAFFGTTIAPYMFFWQANQEVEEKIIEECKPGKICRLKPVSDKELETIKLDTRMGMTFSNIITFFIIILSTATLYHAGINNIESLEDAAKVLRPLAGDYAYYLFTIGILSSGFIGIPVLAGSAAYVLAEIFNWPRGLDKTFTKAKEFYSIIIASTLVGLLIPLFGFHPIKAMFYTALLFGLISPIIILIILHMANNKKMMGDHINSKRMNFWGHLTFGIMTVVSILSLLILF